LARGVTYVFAVMKPSSLHVRLALGFTTAALGCAPGAPRGKPVGGAGGLGGAAASTGVAGDTAVAEAGTTGTAGASDAAAAGTTGVAGIGGAAGVPADAGSVADASNGPDPLAGWTLSWSDEFNDAAGTKPNPQSWGYDLGGGGWGLMQLQVYTSAAANAAMDGNGNLAVTVIKDAQGGFTSARLKTQGKVEQAYGRFEVRAKVTTGNGMWPAFWMLGNNFGPTPWPQCGEIDIMELRGTQPFTNLGSLHGPGYSGSHPLTGHFSLPDTGPKLSDDFHIYAVEWETGVVRFYVDTNLYETQTPADTPAGTQWVYDHPFFILLNVAVGGTFPGPPDGTVFPQTMLVDYVRVYTRANGGG
jgi:beta-glucanase (GH16 family)